MASEAILDEQYASEEDSDFAPDVAPAEAASGDSESEDDADQPPRGSKRRRADNAPADEDFENSGDEAIIQRGKKKRQKKAKRKDGEAEDDDGGEGGLIKTRSMRAVEKAERKSHAVTGPVTIDVDDLWAKMTAVPVIPPKQNAKQQEEEREDQQQQPTGKDHDAEGTTTGGNPKAPPHMGNAGDTASREPPAMIKIKRTYNFAGKVHTEEKLVARDSAEARLHLASRDPRQSAAGEGTADDDDDDNGDGIPKRQPRPAFRSAFEPVVEGLATGRVDLDLGLGARLRLREAAAAQQGRGAKRVNVVEKSRMDWAGFVDRAGIKDELELAGKSKQSYAHRQDFLARVEANREEEARRARMAERV
ncbi:bucentaur or craniofacial development-domain-containing protein [Xylariaceae sp. FL0804]|nr:bucentaur or craniofacial development-domain-containing protein [Xylariaceae sp. FL0804]